MGENYQNFPKIPIEHESSFTFKKFEITFLEFEIYFLENLIFEN